MIADYINQCGHDKSSTLELVVNEVIHNVLDEIDNDLLEMITEIDSGTLSNKEVVEKIEKMRKLLL